MSMGVGGRAYLASEDERIVRYSYGSFDWNDPKHYNDDRICDGSITIHKNLLSEFPDRSKWIANRVIEVVNCSNCYAKTSDGYEIETIALSLIFRILGEYETNGLFSEKCSICK